MAVSVKPERKLYKGRVENVVEIANWLKDPIPVQPVNRTHGFATLPSSFILTRIAPGFQAGHKVVHYYVPSSGQRSYVEIGDKAEFNILEGRHKEVLATGWKTALETRFSTMARRLACSIGADPEIFVVNSKGTVIPAWEFLGSKQKPYPYTNRGGYGKLGDMYWDGFQAEWTTNPGVSCLVAFTDSVHYALEALHKRATEHNDKAKLSLASVLPVSPAVLAKAKAEHVAFGCAPSANIYGLRGNTQDGRDVPYRFAGGHIHFGLTKEQKAKIPAMVRMMDNVLGVACVSLFANYDSPIRRQFYGQAGEHRTPPHGLEYRVLSNAWLAHPLITHMVFELARAAAGLVDEGLEYVWKADEKETVETIMNHDVASARKILERNNKVFLAILASAATVYGADDGKEVAWRAWSTGMESIIKDPTDLVTNWRLGPLADKWGPDIGYRHFYSAAPLLTQKGRLL